MKEYIIIDEAGDMAPELYEKLLNNPYLTEGYKARLTKDHKSFISKKHRQLTPLWKRVIHFFRRAKFSRSNLENL